MGDGNYKVKLEYGVAITVILVGLFFIYQATTIATSKEAVGPRTMPLFLSISMVIGGLWLALRAFLGKVGELKAGYGFLESDISRIGLVVGCGVLFVFTFWAAGYFAAIFITILAMLFTFGVRNWLKMLAGAAILSLTFQWLFMGIMRLNDPKGVLINLKPYTGWITGE